MSARLCLTFLVIALVAKGEAATRTSANYSIATETEDAGGRRTSSANYTNDGSAGGTTGITTVATYVAKNGYVGQLYDVVALSVTAPPSANLNEATSRQLVAAPLADDATTLTALDPSTVNWSIVTGPITSISTSGLATAATVYQDTAATVGGTALSLSGQFNLTILNVNVDNFDAYAGDQIDDSWQVQYFGQPPNANAGPNADPDHDGQTNLFEFTAGLIPNDPNSHFVLSIQNVAGQPTKKNLVFNPIVAGRTYTPQFRANLTTGTWDPLTGTTQSDIGNQRTVTDNSATGPKNYRIQITKP